MRKSKFTAEQIIAILAEQERGMDVSDARKLKTLETENARLKRLLADSMLDNSILKDLLGKP